ncbi:MAG: DUF1887 family protein [Clostridia bacterium]|nr:DUF1887 family protein [Clostridia bacterium]
MKTLIELYDERPLENVLSTEVFRPERTVFICPPEVAQDQPLQNKLREYFRHRGIRHECIFLSASLVDAQAVERRLREVTERYPDCALDIAGGTDAALFAGGLLCAERQLPVFTYSRKRNTFFNISGADFADHLACGVQLTVEDCFLMAGGSMRQGRVDNAILSCYMEIIDPLFALYLRFRREWPRIVTYIQRVSQKESGLEARGGMTAKGEHGSRVSAPLEALVEMERLGLIGDLSAEDETVAFRFADSQIRAWLRDVGSALELYIYKACLDLGVFSDVRTSAVVDWQGSKPSQDSVTNELDVMATCGVLPVFISCKTCDVKTEALNELAILRDRFGGQGARAAIVTAERGRGPMRHRAMELGIDVIDLDDLGKRQVLLERIGALLR